MVRLIFWVSFWGLYPALFSSILPCLYYIHGSDEGRYYARYPADPA